jgi:hypothetical protein
MSQSYGFMGWTQFWGALFTYYVVANDFGIPPSSMHFIALIDIVKPNLYDTYNPTAINFGNTNLPLNSCNF